MKITIVSIALITSLILNVNAMGDRKTSPCIRPPAKVASNEREAALKLSAELVGGIAKPGFDASYKRKVNTTFAELSQRNVDQLVLLETLLCIKKHHRKELSAANVASIEREIQKVLANTTGARSVEGKLSAGSKEQIGRTPFGEEKLAAIEELGL